jgi:hypothetical protein
MRGWELCDCVDRLQPVYDEDQKKMADELVVYFVKSKLRILAPGIEAYYLQGDGVERTRYGGV